MSAADRVVASWTEVTGCGTRYEDLTADGQVHVDYTPPLGEPWFEGDDDPDYNPICGCPRQPKQWCDDCMGCVVCGQCREARLAAALELITNTRARGGVRSGHGIVPVLPPHRTVWTFPPAGAATRG